MSGAAGLPGDLPGPLDPAADRRLQSPSFERNAEPILEVLRPRLEGHEGTVLEIGAGPGQHAAFFAAGLRPLRWLASDPQTTHLRSIEAWRAEAEASGRATRLERPVRLDASTDWAEMPEIASRAPFAAVYSQNVVHITPWTVTVGTIEGAAKVLAPGGLLIFYGPFMESGVHTSPGNATFDASLKAQTAEWGLRDVDALGAIASDVGLKRAEIVAMPADNRIVIFRR